MANNPKGIQNIIKRSEWQAIKKIGTNIKELRTKKNWTLESVEERGYRSWKHWQSIEAGQRNINMTTLLRIAKVLKVKPERLLSNL